MIFRAHDPGRMLERLLHRHGADGFERPGAERPAGSGQDDTADFFALARHHRLEHRVVFGIDRQDRRCRRRRATHEQSAGTNQTFLIGERDGRAALGRSECRFQTRRTGDRRHDPLGGRCAASTKASVPAAASMPEPDSADFNSWYAEGSPTAAKRAPSVAGEIRQRSGVAVCGHRLDAIVAGLALQQIDGARTDRAGGAEQRHRFRRARQIRSGRRRCRLLHLVYHTSKPWAGASGPCRRMPIRSATNAATRKPSRRSISPP